ncbi:MAG TPA: alpha/beta hydrolase [Chitinophagaceae bacterium]|nr:alpha/beta hydrolase [Chitinophagaceae bacterium]
MKKVYFIGGLGADKRIFSFLNLSFCKPIFIDWITPVPKESLKEYALRLRKQIDDESPIVVGISFGGMLITEMAKADPLLKGIILASNKTSKEFPAYLRIGKYLPLYKWAPSGLSKKTMLANSWILGGIHEPQKKLLYEIVKDSNMFFVKWAIGAILRWENNATPKNIIHIHGTADKLLPFRLVKADFKIINGTHILTMDQPGEVSELLKKLI